MLQEVEADIIAMLFCQSMIAADIRVFSSINEYANFAPISLSDLSNRARKSATMLNTVNRYTDDEFVACLFYSPCICVIHNVNGSCLSLQYKRSHGEIDVLRSKDRLGTSAIFVYERCINSLDIRCPDIQDNIVRIVEVFVSQTRKIKS